MSKRRPIKITIPGDPIPWKRPGQNKKKRYDDQNAQKHSVGAWAKSQMRILGVKTFQGPLSVSYEFLMPIPEYRKREILSIIKNGATVWHITTPDTDNLIKFYGDALNKILWKDDCLICSVNGEKFYSLNPRTIVEVSEL